MADRPATVGHRGAQPEWLPHCRRRQANGREAALQRVVWCSGGSRRTRLANRTPACHRGEAQTRSCMFPLHGALGRSMCACGLHDNVRELACSAGSSWISSTPRVTTAAARRDLPSPSPQLRILRTSHQPTLDTLGPAFGTSARSMEDDFGFGGSDVEGEGEPCQGRGAAGGSKRRGSAAPAKGSGLPICIFTDCTTPKKKGSRWCPVHDRHYQNLLYQAAQAGSKQKEAFIQHMRDEEPGGVGRREGARRASGAQHGLVVEGGPWESARTRRAGNTGGSGR